MQAPRVVKWPKWFDWRAWNKINHYRRPPKSRVRPEDEPMCLAPRFSALRWVLRPLSCRYVQIAHRAKPARSTLTFAQGSNRCGHREMPFVSRPWLPSERSFGHWELTVSRPPHLRVLLVGKLWLKERQ